MGLARANEREGGRLRRSGGGRGLLRGAHTMRAASMVMFLPRGVVGGESRSVCIQGSGRNSSSWRCCTVAGVRTALHGLDVGVPRCAEACSP